MARIVPLVVYKGFTREIIGEAHVEDEGVVVCIIYDSKVVETLGLASEMSLGFPFSRNVPPYKPGYTVDVDKYDVVEVTEDYILTREKT